MGITKLTQEQVAVEYENLKRIFEDCVPEQLKLNDGLILETARIKAELNYLNALIIECGGRFIYNPKNPKQQKELPASRSLEKIRASYRENMKQLSRALGVNIDENEDDGLSDYE